jgi:uncharacterized protein
MTANIELGRNLSLEYFVTLAVVAFFSVIQSLFGMGLLVFGTPTLLLMGYDFITTLGFLLPASFAISLLQVLTAGPSRVPVSPYLYLLCLPGIGLGLWLTEASPLASWTNTLVGGTLLLSVLVRFWLSSQRFFSTILERYIQPYHLVMGIIHGLTNLGGALLAILASGTNTNKDAIRYTIAHYYLAFCTIQIFILAAIMGHHAILISNLPTAAISSTVYLLIGNRIFRLTSNPSYHIALSVFMAVYGVLVLLNF